MAVVSLQPFLADKIGVGREIEVDLAADAVSLGRFLDLLFSGNKLFRYSLKDETGKLRPHIGVFIDNRSTRDLDALVSPDSSVFIVQALSGG